MWWRRLESIIKDGWLCKKRGMQIYQPKYTMTLIYLYLFYLPWRVMYKFYIDLLSSSFFRHAFISKKHRPTFSYYDMYQQKKKKGEKKYPSLLYTQYVWLSLGMPIVCCLFILSFLGLYIYIYPKYKNECPNCYFCLILRIFYFLFL